MQINGIVSGRTAHIKPVSNQNTYPSTVESTCWEHGIDIYSSQRMSHECSICFCRYATVRMLSFAHVRIVKLINYLENWQRATVCDVSCLLQVLLCSTLTCTTPNSISNSGKASKEDSLFLFLFCSGFFLRLSETGWLPAMFWLDFPDTVPLVIHLGWDLCFMGDTDTYWTDVPFVTNIPPLR